MPLLVAHFIKTKTRNNVKKNNLLIIKLNSIKTEIKERVLLLYFNRMKFFYNLKSLKWSLLRLEEQSATPQEVSSFLVFGWSLLSWVDSWSDEID